MPLYKGAKAARTISLRNHYYGYGEGSTPPDRAYYIQSGRPSDLAASVNPTLAYVPQTGSAGNKPYFGYNAIDAAHAHQFPHWGSLLWKTPEFAFLGHKFWDQTRLYSNLIIAEPSLVRWADREGAWAFLHAVMAWKTGSANSDRLYSRQEVIDFVVKDFEWFNDNHKVTTPGFDNPPTNFLTNGAIDEQKLTYAGANKFGPFMAIGGGDWGTHDFMVGYWLTALGIGEKLGFNAAVRAASAKAGQVLDWMIAQHRKRVVGRINQAPLANQIGDYLFPTWSASALAAANGSVAALPQNFAAVATQNGNGPSWDVFAPIGGSGLVNKDGQGPDQLRAGPSILKNQLGQTGTDIDAALATVTGWRTQKKTEQQALGTNAGSTWFIYLNAVNNPAIS